jgi:hypothetical protein
MRSDYVKFNPHDLFKSEILEDVKIGIYLAKNKIKIKFYDLTDTFTVRMYESVKEAIQGLTKNSFSAFKDFTPLAVLLYFVCFLSSFLLFLFYKEFLMIIILQMFGKFLSDLKFKFPLYLFLIYPFSIALFGIIILWSYLLYKTNGIEWKGRKYESSYFR